MANESTLSSTNRKEFIDTAIKATALMDYKLRSLCNVESADAWTLTYFQRTNTVEATGGGTGSSIAGVPQMAPFAYIEQPLTKVSAVMKKYAGESVLPLETLNMATVPMLKEIVQTVSRCIAYAQDVAIEAVLSASAGNTFALTAGYEWDSATPNNQQPVYDILYGQQMLRADAIDPLKGNLYLVVNGTDYVNLVSNSKLLNNPTFKIAQNVENGVMGEIAHAKIMVSEAVTADQAYLVVAQTALTIKEAEPLTTAVIDDPGKSTTIRAWGEIAIQIPVPNAVCKITNTRK